MASGKAEEKAAKWDGNLAQYSAVYLAFGLARMTADLSAAALATMMADPWVGHSVVALVRL